MSSPDEMSAARSKRRKIIAVVVLAALAAGVIGTSLWPKHRVVVRNHSGAEVKNIVLEMQSMRGDWELSKSLAVLNAGGSFDVRHSRDSMRADLRFEVAGQQFQFSEDHMGFWETDAWFFDIQPDGSVKSGMDKGDDH